MFSQKQVAEFKEGFQFMDRDKDGVIDKNDLRATFDETGRLASDDDLEEMLADASGPINFTMFLNMFAERQTGEADDDELVAKAFKAFADDSGKIDADHFRHNLMIFGDKFTSDEVDDAFDNMEIDDSNRIDCAAIVGMLTASTKEEDE